MLMKINPTNPQERLIDRIATILKKGGIIAYPTDTMYGIGCDIMNKKAIEKIYKLKQRKKNTPFSFICSEFKDISDYAKVSNYGYKIMKNLLPGPYTFVLKASKLVPKIMLTKQKSAGIRIPINQICRAIVKSIGNPIISTSATTKDKTILSNPSLINEYFGKHLNVVIDGGTVPGEPSSVISLLSDEPKVLRKGLGETNIFNP